MSKLLQVSVCWCALFGVSLSRGRSNSGAPSQQVGEQNNPASAPAAGPASTSSGPESAVGAVETSTREPEGEDFVLVDENMLSDLEDDGELVSEPEGEQQIDDPMEGVVEEGTIAGATTDTILQTPGPQNYNFAAFHDDEFPLLPPTYHQDQEEQAASAATPAQDAVLHRIPSVFSRGSSTDTSVSLDNGRAQDTNVGTITAITSTVGGQERAGLELQDAGEQGATVVSASSSNQDTTTTSSAASSAMQQTTNTDEQASSAQELSVNTVNNYTGSAAASCAAQPLETLAHFLDVEENDARLLTTGAGGAATGATEDSDNSDRFMNERDFWWWRQQSDDEDDGENGEETTNGSAEDPSSYYYGQAWEAQNGFDAQQQQQPTASAYNHDELSTPISYRRQGFLSPRHETHFGMV
ncbi:unnamed protein product [Amoebophrya sp. A120]|nr:unnamed protein product [Amoebophrya sp. A120]|eukprot:GSA120T00018222001.1